MERLFRYISQVFSIGLPEDRDVRKYDAEIFWYADIHTSPQCKIRSFDPQPTTTDPPGGAAWLWVKKESMPAVPALPSVLEGWIEVSNNPLEHSKNIASKNVDGVQENFEHNADRVNAFVQYQDIDWLGWAAAAKPIYLANKLYDKLFTLHQRLSIESDKFEILWGHLFLSWQSDNASQVYHPFFLTALNLTFNAKQRTITLAPSESIPTKFELECVRGLPVALEQNLHQLTHNLNSSEITVDVWDDGQMSGLASQITGYIYNADVTTMNRYETMPVVPPLPAPVPVVYNAPVIFVRARNSRKWVDDAKSIAQLISDGADVNAFIKGLVLDPNHPDFPDPARYQDDDDDDDDGENLLPLEYNEQQREIVTNLKQHFGALVQGPPGTGKSHTIANIVSSLLARGKRVLVTSQTENALRVLRDKIPKEIQSLCVSQLGNDSKAKQYLTEAVQAVGLRRHERNGQHTEAQIQRIRQELRQNREEQAVLRNNIRDWASLDALTLSLDGTDITAHQAAKECAENEADAGWFPDQIPSDVAPPLDDVELAELCMLLQTHSADTRAAVTQHFPELSKIIDPQVFSEIIAELRTVKELLRDTAAKRATWGTQLQQADLSHLKEAQRLLENAGNALQSIFAEWMQIVLNLIAENARQLEYWQNVRRECSQKRDEAYQCFHSIQQFQIATPDAFASPETGAALGELDKLVKAGCNPVFWWHKLRLSKSAKQLLETTTVDGGKLTTAESVQAAVTNFRYRTLISKIVTYWNQSASQVGGTQISAAAGMPLQDIDTVLSRLEDVSTWYNKHHNNLVQAVQSLGCQQTVITTQDVMSGCLEAINGQLADHRRKEIAALLGDSIGYLSREAAQPNASPLIQRLINGISAQSTETYQDCYRQISHYISLLLPVRRIEELTARLRVAAPKWRANLVEAASTRGVDAIRTGWKVAWSWQRLNSWLTDIHARESVDSLQNKLELARRKEQKLITQLVVDLTWQRQMTAVDDRAYQALVAWKHAMDNYGAGAGRHAQHWLNMAAIAMKDAVKAVPVWIMPLHKVVDSFSPAAGIFDVVIVDEASQCDLRALSVLFRAKKVLVVGDPEQISPSNIGIPRDIIHALISQNLQDIPNAAVKFYIDNSLFEIAEYSLQRMLLTEHFRCVPPIIEFNNWLCPSYGGKLEPLRQPNPAERLDPPINTIFVGNGHKKDNDVNEQEAEALVAKLISCCQDERYRGCSMGVISLLGEKQAQYISNLLSQHLSEVEIEERRIICGNAYAFQGDERDVMFLSLVIAGNARFAALVTDNARRRFNVATSRAKDQVFLFHSVSLDQITNTTCVRHKLLSWYLNPPIAEMEAGIEVLRLNADSPFEIEVGERIIRRGYKVIPQYRPFGSDRSYRIDLVIQGNHGRLAVECDGERWHGPTRWEYDQRREAQLRRAGWKFWRISGSAFYRKKDASLEGLWVLLDELGIEPILVQRDSVVQQNTSDSHISIEEDNVQMPNVIADVNVLGITSIPPIEGKQAIVIGNMVKVYDEVTDRSYRYKIGFDKDGQGYVAPESPVGKVLIGAAMNQMVEIEMPTGPRPMKIVEII